MGAPRFLKDLATAIGLGHPADSFAAARPSAFAPIVLGGCGRSGTTLLRMMLDSHRRICCGPESSLFRRRALDPEALADRFGFPREAVRAIYEASRSRPAFIEGFAALCMQQAGKQRWAEKTPRNISRIGEVFRWFPEARFIHVLRDGRDVACSLQDTPAPQGRGWQARAARDLEADRRLRAALARRHRGFAALVGRSALPDRALRGAGARIRGPCWSG